MAVSSRLRHLTRRICKVIDPSAPAVGIGYIVATFIVSAESPCNLGAILTDPRPLEQNTRKKLFSKSSSYKIHFNSTLRQDSYETLHHYGCDKSKFQITDCTN